MKEPLQIDTSGLMQNPKYRPVIFDYEVLKYETQLAMYDVWAHKWVAARTPEGCGALMRAYLIDPRTVFVGFNNKNFDNLIATACIDGWSQADVYALNNAIIHDELDEPIHGVQYENYQELRFRLPNVWTFAKRAWDAGFDLGTTRMSSQGVKIPCMSLKKWEKFNGIKVTKTPIPFTHPLPLTDKEAKALAEYNKYDVAATTLMICTSLIGKWETRCGFADMLGPKKFGWHKTFTKLAADLFVTHPEKKTDREDISWAQTIPKLPKCLRIEKHPELLKYFSKRLFEIEEQGLSIPINGIIHNFRIGGAHSVSGREVHKGDIWHVDASGFYPATMALFDLCSPAMDKKKFNKHRLMRMVMPKSDPRRVVLKQSQNSAYGGMLEPFSDLYYPANARQTCIFCQLFIVDFLERVEPYSKLIQTNTDGVYLLPNSEEDKKHITAAIKEFENRTGLVMDVDRYVEMYQRDVNNYIVIAADGSEIVKGGAFRSTNHARPSVGQMMNRCEIMDVPFNPDQYTLEELAIVCTRDKNSRGFSIDGKETDADTIDVVPVFPFQAHEIYTVNKDGSFRKARLCPDFAALTSDTDRAEIDWGYYQTKKDAE